jgi:hypothetical protein
LKFDSGTLMICRFVENWLICLTAVNNIAHK